MTAAAWIIGLVLAVAVLTFILAKFGWAIRTQPQGRWRGPARERRAPRGGGSRRSGIPGDTHRPPRDPNAPEG